MLNNFGNGGIFPNVMMNMNPQQFCSPVTEKEIENHKKKLNLLINKLNNTHNIEEETSINNEIKNEAECLSSLLNIKKND